ncbi:sugar phosphate isomerase/epimerase family protein [Leptolyngbya sp. 7M]|uniref:sugar phosphate isomerase/epimerase family protein n=1 Tax=Leptolyngbya sp. 7M TaxID=2812896 RepID=UPI001B8CB073|nr:hypothetical protein [Leptolyngbya sp. 7M]QYO67256.1 sugar phosphate isomerase/epimerase [Leptolyngbya sp. 7M]
MKLAINGATTMTADLETDIRAAAAAGFELVELRSNKLYDHLEKKTIDDLKALLAETGVGVLSINTLEHITWRSDEDYAAIKEECEKLSSISAAIGCPSRPPLKSLFSAATSFRRLSVQIIRSWHSF